MAERRLLVWFINMGHALDHMMMLIFPTAILAMGDAFGERYEALLALSLGGFIAFGAGSLPAGWLGDRWGRRNMLAVFFLGLGTAAILTGLSPSPVWLGVTMTAMGMFAAIYHPVGTALLVAGSDRMGRAIGVNGVWGNLGIASAAGITGVIVTFLGWRFAFILPGGVAVILGLLFLRLVPDEGRPKPHPVPHQAPRPAATQVPGQQAPQTASGGSDAVRAFIVLALVSIFGSIVFQSVTISLPKLLDERLTGLTGLPIGIGAVVFSIYLAGAVTQLIIGRLLDRHSLRRIFLPIAALQAPFLILAAFAGGWLVVAAMSVMMVAIFGQVTINDAMVAHYTRPAWRSRVYAVRYMMSFGASAAAVPLVARLHEAGAGVGAGTGTGFTDLFLVLAGCGAMVFLGALVFPRTGPGLSARPAR